MKWKSFWSHGFQCSFSALAHRYPFLDKLSCSGVLSSPGDCTQSLIFSRLSSSLFSVCIDFQTYNGSLLCARHPPRCGGHHNEENRQVSVTFEQHFEGGKRKRKEHSR